MFFFFFILFSIGDYIIKEQLKIYIYIYTLESNKVQCWLQYFGISLIWWKQIGFGVAATCLVIDVCHYLCNPLVQWKEERRQSMVGRHWERNWKKKGTISLHHSHNFQSSFKKTLNFSQKRNIVYIFWIFKSGTWFHLISNSFKLIFE